MTYLAAGALPAFLASLVEFVEALTIVLAVGATRGWRSALAGASAALAALTLLVAAFGPALHRAPVDALQLFIGVLLLFFGMRWLRKAILRYAGAIPLHDETAIFAKRRASLAVSGQGRGGIDALGFGTAFQAVALEGLEVVFIVIAVGAPTGALLPAAVGAAAAGVLVIIAGALLHRPLARVPENGLKLAVGIMLSAFGTFWTAKGLHAVWPGDDVALLELLAGFAASAAVAYAVARAATRPTAERS